jgi:hypothetical protein
LLFEKFIQQAINQESKLGFKKEKKEKNYFPVLNLNVYIVAKLLPALSLIAVRGIVTMYHVFAVLLVVLMESVVPLMVLVSFNIFPALFLMVILLK